MKRLKPLTLSIAVCALFWSFPMSRALADEYRLELFRSAELIYDEAVTGDCPHQQSDVWLITLHAEGGVQQIDFKGLDHGKGPDRLLEAVQGKRLS